MAFSTLFFQIFGVDNWRMIAFIWALVPLYNGAVFTKVPIPALMKEGEKGLSVGSLFSTRIFLVLFVMMVCAYGVCSINGTFTGFLRKIWR